jgi:hypothetical protein
VSGLKTIFFFQNIFKCVHLNCTGLTEGNGMMLAKFVTNFFAPIFLFAAYAMHDNNLYIYACSIKKSGLMFHLISKLEICLTLVDS